MGEELHREIVRMVGTNRVDATARAAPRRDFINKDRGIETPSIYPKHEQVIPVMFQSVFSPEIRLRYSSFGRGRLVAFSEHEGEKRGLAYAGREFHGRLFCIYFMFSSTSINK